MKKLLCLLLAAAAVFALTACGGGSKKKSSESPSATLDLPSNGPHPTGIPGDPDEPSTSTDEPSSAQPTADASTPTADASAQPTADASAQPTADASTPTADASQTPSVQPTADKTEAATQEPAEKPTVVYGAYTFTDTKDVVCDGDELKSGSLYDTSKGEMVVGNLIELYPICSTVEGVRVFGLINDTVRFSQEAAQPLNALCEAAYRATGMRVNLRTAEHMEATAVGYADYLSRRSVRVSYIEDAMTYAFSSNKAKPLADFFREYAHEYGFIELSAEGDDGHFRYVGVPHATVMKDKGYKTLSEYHTYLATLTNALTVTIGDATYYVQSFVSNGLPTTVKVPAAHSFSYEISATGNGTMVLTAVTYVGGGSFALPYVADKNIDRSKTVICLDAGHGAHDPGAVFTHGDRTLYEKNFNLAVALQAKAYLEAMGYTVVMTREGDTFRELSDRVNFAVSNKTTLFVSFHCNSTDYPESPTAVGPQIYFNQSMKTEYLNWTTARTFRNAINAATASFIANGLTLPVDESDLRDGSHLAVLSNYSLPSILLEMGFITNKGDAAMFENPKWQESYGYAVALAVETLFYNNHLGVQ